jgi:hypothetical protein
MAGHAVFILREVGDFFAHREVGLKVGVLEFNGIGRGLKEAPEDVAAEIDTAMDGGGLFVVGKGGENVGVGEESSPLFVRSGEEFEGVRFGSWSAVEFGETRVEIDLLLGEEAAVVGLLRPDDTGDKEIERSPEVGDDFFIESGKKLGILVEVFFFGEV